jgi:hypothetical protein
MIPRTGHASTSQTRGGPLPIGRFRSVVRALPEIDGRFRARRAKRSTPRANTVSQARHDRVTRTLDAERPTRPRAAALDFMLSLDIYLNRVRDTRTSSSNAPQLEHGS